MLNTIVDSIGNFLLKVSDTVGIDLLFFISLAIEAVIVIFFLVKSIFSYEARLNRMLEKLNYWLFEKKNVTEDNIQELNTLFKTKAPKRLCYYWQQYILFREGTPSTYMSTENLVEKPLKTSSYDSNIRNLTLLTCLWAFFASMFVIVGSCFDAYMLGENFAMAICVPIFVLLIGIIFIIYLRARKNAILNSLYQNTSLFGRFMDNACVDLPSYIDYQILFTPQEIESGQPVLREFLDYRARKEKEEFNKAKEEDVGIESFDFSATGVNGSMVLDRAMRESEKFLKKKEKVLVKIAQLEAELDSRRKNFDNVQKDYQTKIQASKENVDRLRQLQEETTNRIESNYYRKQQSQEVGKQEQYEQEFEQQRTKYLLEKSECEEEINKLNEDLEVYKGDVEVAMLSEYQTFFDKFCKSAEMVVGKAFKEKFEVLKEDNEAKQEQITQLEIKLKNRPEDGSADEVGQYDENGNYVYADGTFYDRQGNFHDASGNIYSQDGKLISKAETKEEDKTIVDFDSFDAFDFMTDVAQKGDIYGVAEDVVKSVDDSIEVINNSEKSDPMEGREKKAEEEKAKTEAEKHEKQKKVEEPQPAKKDDFDEFFNQSTAEQPEETVMAKEPEPQIEKKVEETPAKPRKKAGRPRKIVSEPVQTPAKKRGRPKKEAVEEKTPVTQKRKVGRPKKIVKEGTTTTEKRGRGRPRKESIQEINKRLNEEEERINNLRSSLNQDLEKAMNEMNKSRVDDNAAKRDAIIKEIDKLQKEAQNVISDKQSDDKIADINSKLEKLLAEIKKMN